METSVIGAGLSSLRYASSRCPVVGLTGRLVGCYANKSGKESAGRLSASPALTALVGVESI